MSSRARSSVPELVHLHEEEYEARIRQRVDVEYAMWNKKHPVRACLIDGCLSLVVLMFFVTMLAFLAVMAKHQPLAQRKEWLMED